MLVLFSGPYRRPDGLAVFLQRAGFELHLLHYVLGSIDRPVRCSCQLGLLMAGEEVRQLLNILGGGSSRREVVRLVVLEDEAVPRPRLDVEREDRVLQPARRAHDRQRAEARPRLREDGLEEQPLPRLAPGPTSVLRFVF